MKNEDSGMRGKGPGMKHQRPEMKELTDAQKSTANQILAKYDLKNMSKTEAQALFNALEKEDIHGPEVFGLIEEAGADPKQIFDMVMDGKHMPPHGGKGNGKPPAGRKPPEARDV